MKRKTLFTYSLLGILLMIIGQLCFSINDTIVKFEVKKIENIFSIFNIIFIRGIFATIIIFIYLYFFKKKNIFKIIWNKNYYFRGIYEVATALFFFTGLMFMPISQVYTLLMTNPFFVTIFAYFFLKERVGLRRWTAVIIGFVGVLIIIKPQNMSFNYLFLFPILAAIFLTIRDINTKNIVTKENSFEIIFITSLLICIFSGLSSLYFGFEVKLNQIPNIFISAIFLTIAYLFSVLTIFYAPLSLTASSRYSVIIFGIIFGYLILNEIPTFNMIVGAVIITSSGIFVIKRQKDLGKIE